MKSRAFWILGLIGVVHLHAQNDYNTSYTSQEEEEINYFEPINDATRKGQTTFVYELLDLAGYNIDYIKVYQTLPNNARVFQVKYNEESQGGFIFIRWDKEKKENYVANKLIDPGVYYNLKAAKEIMRRQTDQKDFGVQEAALQAPDQEKISPEDLEGLRQKYDLEQEQKKLQEIEKANAKSRKKSKRKQS